MIKKAWEVEIGDTINGQLVIGLGRQGWYFTLIIMDKLGCITELGLIGNAEIMVDNCQDER